MKPALFMEMNCTTYVCGSMLTELWPEGKPYVVTESVSGFSAAHKQHFQAIAAANGGRILVPLLKKYKINPADVSGIVLAGFSAGCWGVAEMLADPDVGMVSAVLCVDGLHYPTGAKFETFARRAAAGEVMLVDLYSAIPVSGYTSTRDSARKLASIVGASSVAPVLPGSDESWNVGGFYAVGFPGKDKQAHIDQVNKYQPLAWQHLVAPWVRGKSTGSGTGAKPPAPTLPYYPGQPCSDPATIRYVQTLIGATPDGKWGPQSQAKLDTVGGYYYAFAPGCTGTVPKASSGGGSGGGSGDSGGAGGSGGGGGAPAPSTAGLEAGTAIVGGAVGFALGRLLSRWVRR